MKILINRMILGVVIGAVVTSVSVSNSAIAQDQHEADPMKLEQKAGRSKDLFVAPSFNFNTSTKYMLDLVIEEIDNSYKRPTMLKIYAIPSTVETLDDPALENSSLIHVVKPDDYGRVYEQYEFPNSVDKILIEVNRQAQGNKIIVALDKQEDIRHYFDLK